MSEAQWTLKYAPQRISEIVGNAKSATTLTNYLDHWDPDPQKMGPDTPRGVLLVGRSGVGKTSSVYAYAKEHDCVVTEFNASDTRNSAAILSQVKDAATINQLFSKKRRILLIDEVDGLHGTFDKGAAVALIKVLKISCFPMIFTANDEQSKRITGLKRHCLVIRYERPKAEEGSGRIIEVEELLRSICNKEGIETEEAVLRAIAKVSGGDMRAAVNDLQNLAKGLQKLDKTLIPLLKNRDATISIFAALKIIATRKDFTEVIDSTNELDVDYREYLMWVFENAHNWATDGNYVELAQLYDSISKADQYLTRIVFTQNWGLLKYFFLHLSAGINIRIQNKGKKFPRVMFPQTWGKLSKLKSMRAQRAYLLSTFGESTHTSIIKNTTDTLPYLKYIFEHNPRMAAEIAIAHKIPQAYCKKCDKEYQIDVKIPSTCPLCHTPLIFVMEYLVGSKKGIAKIRDEYIAIRSQMIEEYKKRQPTTDLFTIYDEEKKSKRPRKRTPKADLTSTEPPLEPTIAPPIESTLKIDDGQPLSHTEDQPEEEKPPLEKSSTKKKPSKTSTTNLSNFFKSPSK